MSITDDRDRLIHILVVHFDMFRSKAEEAADLFLHDKTLAGLAPAVMHLERKPLVWIAEMDARIMDEGEQRDDLRCPVRNRQVHSSDIALFREVRK